MATAPASAADVPLTPFFHAVAGGVGGMLALVCTYPLDIVKTRIQSSTKKEGFNYAGVTDAVQRIISKEGPAGLYRGLSSGMVATLVNQFSYYYFYEWLKPSYERFSGKPDLGPLLQLILGTHAAAFNCLTTLPITVVNTRIQTSTDEQRRGITATFKHIVEKEGVLALWNGLGPSLILCINPAITYLVFEQLKKWFERHVVAPHAKLSAFHIFLVGAIAKTIATIVTYPYIIAKVRLQAARSVESRLPAGGRRLSSGIMDALKHIIQEGGAVGLYRGMQPQIIKAVLTQAILFMLKEQITDITRVILFAIMYKRPNAPKRS